MKPSTKNPNSDHAKEAGLMTTLEKLRLIQQIDRENDERWKNFANHK